MNETVKLLLSSGVGGTVATIIILMIHKLLDSVFGRDARRHESTQKALGNLHQKRLEIYYELWNNVGGICTPSDPGSRERKIERRRIDDCWRFITQWYKTSGIYLDSESRLWTLILREMCAQELRESNEDQEFSWDQPEWPRLWVVKTALRVSLESALSVPTSLGKEGRTHVTIGRNRKNSPTIHYKVKKDRLLRRLGEQLLVKFEIVDQLADLPVDRKDPTRECIVEQVIETFANGTVDWGSATADP